jgi:tRNA (guanine37-N1)-methyltransferase
VRFDVLTLFPGMFQGPLDEGILARARAAGRIGIRVHDLRRFGVGPHRQVDDAPFGGGPGMVLKPEPFYDAVDWIRRQYPAARERVVLLSPQGAPLDHARAVALASYERLILLCGRYEGLDERVREGLVDEEVAVGEAVVTGGELPAMMLIDAVSRQIEGVLGNKDSAEAESFREGELDHPCYTRPAAYRDREVPPVLLSGDHGAIARWRREAAQRATRAKRPDLLDRPRTQAAPSERHRGTS